MAKIKEKKDVKDDGEESRQMYAVLAIGLVCIFLGLPLWWKTTTTYRASLPYGEIKSLAKTQMQYNVPVSVVSCLGRVEVNLNSLQNQLEHLLHQQDGLAKYSINMRKCNTTEAAEIPRHKHLSELDASFADSDANDMGHPMVYMLPDDHSGFHNTHTFVGRHRTAYVAVHSDDIAKSLEHIAAVLKMTLVNEAVMMKTFISAKGFQHTKADADTMRALRSSLGYVISFSLLNPQPGEIAAHWDIQEAIHMYLEPFTQKLEEFANIVVDSQVLYYTGLAVKPKQSEDKSYHYLSPNQLPRVITPVEAKLASHASTYPSLNFLLYVPKRSHSPLYVTDSKGDRVSTNAFLSPRWGGVMVYNTPDLSNNTNLPIAVNIDMKPAMEVFLSQLRVLIGVPAQTQAALPEVHIEKPSATCITDWEYDVLLRGRALENLATASATIVSLSQLLDKIGNIVINDEIAQQVYQAVEAVKRGHSYLQQGNLYRAFHSSKKAIAASEKAFFDPSLLELLYFPDDQKFAIYIPLFLPISIPVLASLFKAFKWLRSRRKPKQE